MTCNTAIFYDVENLIHPFTSKLHQTLRLDEIHRRILALDMVESVSIQRAYADWSSPANRNLRNFVLQIGIEPVQVFQTNQNDRLKNAADVNLMLDAVELLARNPEIENYVIASGDGIYALLAKKLHAYGKRVIGIGFDRVTNFIFRNSCDLFIELDKNDPSLNAVVRNTLNGEIRIHSSQSEEDAPSAPKLFPKPPKPPVYKPTKKKENKKEHKLPKTKLTEALVAAEIPVWRNVSDVPGTFEMLKNMIDVLFAVLDQDREAEVEVSVFKIYVDHYLPNFRIKQYGYNRFAEFMRFLLTGTEYCLTISDGTVIRIARRGLTSYSGEVMSDVNVASATTIVGEAEKENVEDVVLESDSLESEDISEVGVEPPIADIADTEPSEQVELPESFRTIVKNSFVRLSEESILSTQEVNKLTRAEYCQTALGVTVPVLKEIQQNVDYKEQRQESGRLKYWKEEFVFNKKSYFIFREWAEKSHRNRFEAWLKKVDKKNPKKI